MSLTRKREGDDGIPQDFPWDDCRMLYSNPDGFAVKFLHGKSEQDYTFLVRSAYVDAKSIMSEWIKLYTNPADERLKDMVYMESDFQFLSHILQRSTMLPGEQFFLLISIVYLAQCRDMNGLSLVERFFELHEQIRHKKFDPLNIDSPDTSWVDLAELLADSLDEVRPKIEERAAPTAAPTEAGKSKRNSRKRGREEDDVAPSHDVSLIARLPAPPPPPVTCVAVA